MEIDEERVDEIVLALLHLTTFTDKAGCRAWTGNISRNRPALRALKGTRFEQLPTGGEVSVEGL